MSCKGGCGERCTTVIDSEFLKYMCDVAADAVTAEYGNDRLIAIEISTDPKDAPEDCNGNAW